MSNDIKAFLDDLEKENIFLCRYEPEFGTETMVLGKNFTKTLIERWQKRQKSFGRELSPEEAEEVKRKLGIK